jgi:transcriptional regulator with XRE-family HTH domain
VIAVQTKKSKLSQKDIEAKWEENLAKAKEFRAEKKLNQMRIAELALEVCEISWGGYHLDQKYTLTRFAKEAGIANKSLSGWCSVRRLVYDKLPPKERDSVSYTKLWHIAKRVNKNTPASTVFEKFEEVTRTDSFENKLLRALADLRACSYNFAINGAAEKLSKKTLEEYLFYAEKITKSIKSANRGIQAADHGLAAKNAMVPIGLATALEIPRGTTGQRYKVKDAHGEIIITPKDRDIIQFIQNKDRYFSPTEIGVKLKGHKRDSASAWAYRTLNKLHSLGAVDRNTKGQYRWVGLPA